MKKILYILLIVFVAFSCKDFNEDNFDWYEDAERPTNVANYEFAMTDADYTTIVAALRANKNKADSTLATKLNTAKMFTTELEPAKLIPYLLASKYKAMDVNSSAKVTHQYMERDSVVSRLSDKGYILVNEDYKLSWNDDVYPASFTPKVSPDANLPKILKQRFPSVANNSYKTVEYYYSDEEPIPSDVEGEIYLYETFESYTKDQAVAITGWINKDLGTSANKSWQVKEFSSNKYAQIYTSNGSSDKNDVWMITKKMDFSDVENPYLLFDVTVANWKHDGLTVLVSTDFDGTEANIGSATWVPITDKFAIPQTPTSGYGTLGPAGAGSLASFKGKNNVYIAFRYQGDGTTTPAHTTTFQIDNIKVCELVRGLDVEEKTKMYASYMYKDGAWSKADVINMQIADLVPFGITNGIMTTAQAADYLPQFLYRNYFGAEGAEKVVVYQTKAGEFYADRLRFTSGAWKVDSFIVEMTTPFAYANKDGEKQWIYDPTIIIPISKADYRMIVDYVKDNLMEGNEEVWDTRGNAEYYFGFSEYYGNITYREVGYRDKDKTYPINGTQEEKVKFMNDRTKEGLSIMLALKYPDAVPMVNGVDQKARFDGIIIYYEPDAATNVTWTYTFQCVGDKEWKFVSRESADGRSETAE